MKLRRRQRQRRRRQWLARFSLSLVVLTSAFVLWGWRAPESVLQAALALDAWRSGAEVHVSQVGDHQLAWLAMREQPDRPTLVLLHGFTGRKENWLVLMRAMREQANFIALDLPGWGDSERRDDAAYGFAEQARRVGAFLDALDLPWPLSEGLLQRRLRDAAFERAVLDAIAFSADADLPGREAMRVRQATLLLWCSEDEVIDIDAAEQYAQRIPQAQRHEVADCNHMPMFEQTRATAAALQAFLSSTSLP